MIMRKKISITELKPKMCLSLTLNHSFFSETVYRLSIGRENSEPDVELKFCYDVYKIIIMYFFCAQYDHAVFPMGEVGIVI